MGLLACREGHPAWLAALGEGLGPFGRIRVTATRLVAEGDLVIVEAKGSNTTKAGKPYNNTYCFVFRVTGGKLQEVTEYMDTQLVVEALSEVLPQ